MKLSLLYEAKRIRSGFKLSKFKTLNRESALFYAKGNLKQLGSGSSRDAFLYGSKKVLKVANTVHRHSYSNDGLVGKRQNEAEVAAWTMPGVKPIIAAVYDYSKDDFSWIISELVNQVKNVGQINKYFGSKIFDTEYDFKYFMAYMEDNGSGAIDKWVEDHKFVSPWRFALRSESSPALTDQSKMKLTKFVDAVFEFVNMTGNSDMDIMRHYGFTADGRLIILDYGFSEDVRDKFYS